MFKQVRFGSKTCVEVNLTQEMLDTAQRQADKLGQLNNSIEGGQGNAAGLAGELMMAAYCDVQPSWVISDLPSYQFDLVVPWRDIPDLSLEVKTKRTTVVPRPEYEASIASCNTAQRCDWYVFTRILVKNDGEKGMESRGWLLGYMPRYDYYQKAKFLKKGDYDPSNRFYVKHDCYNLPYGELYPISDLRI